jgi:hypothetical protein
MQEQEDSLRAEGYEPGDRFSHSLLPAARLARIAAPAGRIRVSAETPALPCLLPGFCWLPGLLKSLQDQHQGSSSNGK